MSQKLRLPLEGLVLLAALALPASAFMGMRHGQEPTADWVRERALREGASRGAGMGGPPNDGIPSIVMDTAAKVASAANTVDFGSTNRSRDCKAWGELFQEGANLTLGGINLVGRSGITTFCQFQPRSNWTFSFSNLWWNDFNTAASIDYAVVLHTYGAPTSTIARGNFVMFVDVKTGLVEDAVDYPSVTGESIPLDAKLGLARYVEGTNAHDCNAYAANYGKNGVLMADKLYFGREEIAKFCMGATSVPFWPNHTALVFSGWNGHVDITPGGAIHTTLVDTYLPTNPSTGKVSSVSTEVYPTDLFFSNVTSLIEAAVFYLHTWPLA